MILRRQKSARTGMSLLLALFIAPGYALGNLTGSGSEADSKTVAPAPKRQLAARLAVRGNHPALVNGNGSYTGATILSGSTIQTPGGVRATVQLGRLGSLDLSPNTIAVVSFNNDSVTGTLRTGCATLTANKDVNGVLITPEGESLSTEKTGVSSMSVCSGAPTPVAAAGGGSSSKAPKAGKFGLDSNSTLAMLGASSFAAGGVFGRNSGNSYYGNSGSNGYLKDDRYGYIQDDRKKKDHGKKAHHNGNNDPWKKDHGNDSWKKDHGNDPWKKDHEKKDHEKKDPWKKADGKSHGGRGYYYIGGPGGGSTTQNNTNNNTNNNNNNANGNTSINNVVVNVCVITNSISPSSPPGC